MDDLLKGAYDLHVHTSPDVVDRKCSDNELARRWVDAGMAGGMFKAHFMDTTARAAWAEAVYPELHVSGGLVLNKQVGGINAFAVEKCGAAGGKFIWLPTMNSRTYQAFRNKDNPAFDLKPFIQLVDDEGRLDPALYDVFEAVKQYDMFLCSGHVNPYEGMAVMREAYRCGVRKLVLTHADLPSNPYTIEEQKEVVRMGGLIEHSYFTSYYERTTWETLIDQITQVGPENIFLTTDFGQVKSPYSDEGMRMYAEGLMERGIPYKDIEMMMKIVPAQMLGVK